MKESGLERREGLFNSYLKAAVLVLNVSYLIRVNVNKGEVLEYLFREREANRRVFVELRQEILLSITTYTVKYIFYFVFLYRIVIGISTKLYLYLNLLTLEG